MNLTQEIIKHLDKKGFPDLDFFKKNKTLDNSLEVLEVLLEKERKNFQKLIKKDNLELEFYDFIEDSLLDYFWSILNHLENVNSSEKIRNIIEKFRSKLQDFSNEISYSKEYFLKLVYIENNLKLESDQKRILEIEIKNYKDRGINLSKEKQEEIKKINKKLGKLSQKFTNNIVDDKALFEYEILDFEIIKDLPKDVLEKAKKFGEEKNKKSYIFDANPNSIQAIMKYCSSPKVRKDFEVFSYSIASKGQFDNRKIILEILKLKDRKAKILGYKNYGELSLNSKMADSPKQVIDLINSISKKAKIKAKKEIEELKNYFNLEKLETYDLAYYSRKLKEEKYFLDEEKLREYFELESVLDYMFRFIEKFYSIEIKRLGINSKDDIRVYEVWKNNKLISYYFIDLFYRKEKSIGAWAGNLRDKFIPRNFKLSLELQNYTKIPVVLNVCNFSKGENGKTLLYLRDVEAIFHEFGHALHKILSESDYYSLSGSFVEWDFIELPSQIMENWVKDKKSLKKLAKHYKTGEFIPDEIIEKLEKLKHFMSGKFLVNQSSFAFLDMSIYTNIIPKDIRELDKKSLEYINKFSLSKRGKDYKMYTCFDHIFGGGYAAGYYSYMRAEIFEADVFDRVKEIGMFDKKTGEKLLKTIIGQGTRKKASKLFFDFMKREVDNKAFFKRYGI